MIDPMSICAGLVVGGSAGFLACAMFTVGRASDESDLLINARSSAKYWEERARSLGIKVAEYRAKEQRRLAPLKAQAAKNHAEAVAKRAEKKAFHDNMRAEIEAAAAILNRSEAA